jgi:hypothetical protein
MKKFLTFLASMAFLVLPGLASAQSYYDYGYPSNYGYGNQSYMYPQQNTYYSAYGPSVPEYGCGDHYQFTPCTSYATYQPTYYQQPTSQNYYPQSYYYPHTYMPQQYYPQPQQYYNLYNLYNSNTNTNTNTNVNTIVNNNNSNATALVYIPGYGFYRR